MLSAAPAGHNCTAADSASTSILGYAQIAMNRGPNPIVSGRKPISVTGSSYGVNLVNRMRQHGRQITKPN